MPILDARDLRKGYGPDMILDGVSLSIHEGQRVGLLGKNGCGKSTLARILCGRLEPDDGVLSLRRDAKVAYLPQIPSLDPSCTALQEVLSGLGEWTKAKERYDALSARLAQGSCDLGALLESQAAAAADVERLGGWELSHHAESLLGHLRVEDPGAINSTLSGGMQRRVDLARVLVAHHDLLVLDEPTNHLDLQTVEWLERYLINEHPGALLLITHDRYLLDHVVERTLELDQARLHSYDGGYESYLIGKALRMEQAAREETNRQNFLRSELEWLRRQPKARTGKQKARVQRAEEALSRHPPPKQQRLGLRVDTARTGKAILQLRGLRLGTLDPPLISGLDFTLSKGQRVGVCGPNGCGKTTLLRTLMGELGPAGGEVILGQNTRVSYLSQAREDLQEEASILQNVAGDRGHVVVGDTVIDARSYLQRFLFDTQAVDQPVCSLSGGERTRVALAKLLHRTANLLLLDEPTNDLDLVTLSALEQMLVDFAGTAMVVTHDRWFLDRVATALLVFEGDGEVVLHAGNYSGYLARKGPSKRDKAQGSHPSRSTPREPRRKRSLTYAERLELEGLEEKIEHADQQVAELEAGLANPKTYQGSHTEATRLSRELDQARAAAGALMARWEELETKREG